MNAKAAVAMSLELATKWLLEHSGIVLHIQEGQLRRKNSPLEANISKIY
jgi:hypothetical protein